MGFLNMLGLMKVEDHKAAINSANVEMAKLGNRASEEKSLRMKADDEAVRWKRAYDKAHDQAANNGLNFNKAVKDLAEQSDEIAALNKRLAEAEAAYDNEHADLVTATATIKGLRAQLTAAEEVIAELKPDAEAMRAKRKRDREQKAAKKGAA